MTEQSLKPFSTNSVQTSDGVEFCSERVDVNGVQLHVVRGGNGPALLLLHGWPLTWYSWRKVMPTLAQHFTVIVPDMPGLGDSAPSPSGYEKANIATQMHALVTELGYKDVLLVGHDMGVPVAYAYAVQFPQETKAVAFLDVPLTGFGLEDFARKLGLWHFGFFRTPNLPETLSAGRERAMVESFYPHYAPEAITAADMEEYARTYANPQTMASGLAYYRAFKADEAWVEEASKRKLDTPILAIGGEFAGAGFPFHCFAQLGTNVQGTILAGCGHYLAEEKPHELLETLLPFLNQHTAKSN
jgi:pimeloyl-ACP methyl ester carboxylesterase